MLNKIQDFAENHNIFISYEIVNQINNGEEKAVKKGLIPKITYSVYIMDAEGNEIDIISHDKLDDALKDGISIAERYIKEIK